MKLLEIYAFWLLPLIILAMGAGLFWWNGAQKS